MDILAGLQDKLRFIEGFYEKASQPFVGTKRDIDSGVPPFDTSGFDPEDYNGEPPFLEEWLEADESLNLVGQAALSLVQAALREYLDAFLRLSNCEAPAGRGNWFAPYQTCFRENLSIDWNESPVPPEQIEEINLARNDIQHTGEVFGMTRRQSKEHNQRFPLGLFVHELDKAVFAGTGEWELRLSVTGDNLREAIRRVRAFCEYLAA